MFISPVSLTSPYKPIQQTKLQAQSGIVPLKQPACDVVSFTSQIQFNKFKNTLYRAVDKAEVEALLRGDDVGTHKFVTTDPRGWGAKNWISGFASERRNTCFIQFKENWFDDFEVYNACDDSRDTRYILKNSYSLDDIDVIREGSNAHGKIIWAKSNDSVEKDLNAKISEIFRILKRIMANKKDVVREDIYELSSYIKEFPTVASPLLERVAKDKKFAYEMMFLFEKSESYNYYPYVRNYIEAFSKKPKSCELNEYAIWYMGDHGSHSDLELIFDAMKKDSNRISHSYPYAISKLAEEEDYDKFIKLLDSPEAWMKDIMLLTIKRLEKEGVYQYGTTEKLCYEVLEKMAKIPAEDFQKDVSKQDLLTTCSEILFRANVREEHIPLLEKFTNLGVCTDGDFKFIIRDLVV
jgi:hypothetical protein